MRTLLEQGVLDTIRHYRMLTPGDRVGVAVSGGADSVALLRLLENLRNELGITLLVIHFDHSLRGRESEADAHFVHKLAQARGLECLSGREDVAAAAKEHRWNLEDAGRQLRYAFFARVVREGRATRVAVAHTADDQAETVLAHLIRGTGPTGLGGIYPIVGAIVRPLLRTRRTDLRDYLRDLHQAWREDATNRDLRRLRARIREELLPLLEHDFTLDMVSHLNDLARFAREEEAFWAALVEDRFRALARTTGGSLVIQIADLLSPLALRASSGKPTLKSETPAPLRALTERLIRRLYEELRGDRRELAARHVEQVMHLATASSSGRRVELPGEMVVERNFKELIFTRASSKKRSSHVGETTVQPVTYEYVVSLPERGSTTVSIPELSSCLRLKVIDWPRTASDTKRDGVAFDADLLRNPLILRNWRPGDAYRPRGRRQARKLKTMFLARRVPSRERARWPVLESGGRVIWARGMPAAEDFCAREHTRVGVVVEEDRL
jgi:tRNA(Ile)-lysidine synthase